MVDIFTILKSLQCAKDIQWIKDIDDADIQPFVIQKFLGMSSKLMPYARWLDSYTFHLQPKQYLMLAWAIIPRQYTPHFIRYIKLAEENEDFNPLIDKIRKHLQLSDNDWHHSKKYIMNAITNNKKTWFKKYGMDKRFWKKHGEDFKAMSVGEIRKGKSGLELWGM